MRKIAIFAMLAGLTACQDQAADGTITAEPSLLEQTGALQCSDLESLTAPTTLEEQCSLAASPGVTVTAVSQPIHATIDEVYEVLTEPELFGALPRPVPEGFEPPPVPHSVAIPSAGEPFLMHYRLFYGGLQTSTVRETHDADRIEIVQLWRVNPSWTAEEVAAAYPGLGTAEADALVDTPFMAPGLRTIVTFTIEKVEGSLEDYSHVTMVQHGLPATSYPIVRQHWSWFYLDPILAHFNESP